MQTTLERPAATAGDLYFPTDISPEELFQAIGRLRKEAQDEIERLLVFLDETDGYSTTEQEEAADDVPCDEDELDGGAGGREADDEPSLGWTPGEAARGRYAATYGDRADREDDAGDNGEYDPAEDGIADTDGLVEQGLRPDIRGVL